MQEPPAQDQTAPKPEAIPPRAPAPEQAQAESLTVLPPPPAESTPYLDYDEPAVITVSEPVVGEPVANIYVFFDQLEPYGTWYDDPTYGWAFTPDESNYVPYSNATGRTPRTD